MSKRKKKKKTICTEENKVSFREQAKLLEASVENVPP